MKVKKDRPEKKLVIKVPHVRQRLSTIELLRRLLFLWLEARTAKKRPAKDPAAGMPDVSSWKNSYHFAIVVGEDVVDVMHVQPKMAAWLKSDPKFIQFDIEEGYPVHPGFIYKDGKFVDPNINLDLSPSIFGLKDINEK